MGVEGLEWWGGKEVVDIFGGGGGCADWVLVVVGGEGCVVGACSYGCVLFECPATLYFRFVKKEVVRLFRRKNLSADWTS